MAHDGDLSAIFTRPLRRDAFAIMTAAGVVLSADEIAQRTRRAAQRLAAERVAPGELVLYHGPQGVEAFALFWAAMARGAVFAPLDQEWPDYLVRRAAGALNPRIAVSAPERAPLYRSLFPSARHVSLGADGWEQWLAEAGEASAPDDWAQIGEDAPAAYLFTSGSTDLPKAVVLSRAALAHSGRVVVEHLGWEAGDVLVNTPEPHTMSGLRNAFVAAPLAGVRLRIVAPGARAYAFELMQALREAPCHRLVTSPIVLRQLLMLGDRVGPEAFRRMKAVYCTGATLGGSDVEAFHARFHVPVVNYYGLTETGGICAAQRLAGWRPDDRSIGFAAGAELRVLGEDGRTASVGVGELLVRSPQLMSGYLGDPERTAARFAAGWVRTGDRVRIDPDGRCFLLGRIAGFLKSATTDRIAPEEIEAVLEAHPSVVEAAVLGVASEYEGERIVALVVPRTGAASALELAAFVCERLGPARTPQVRFATRLPRRPSGKIVRTELRGLLGDL